MMDRGHLVRPLIQRIWRRSTRRQRFERLFQDPEWKHRLGYIGPAGADFEDRSSRIHGPGEDRRLPEAGFADYEERAAPASRGVDEQVPNGFEWRVALDKRHGTESRVSFYVTRSCIRRSRIILTENREERFARHAFRTADFTAIRDDLTRLSSQSV
jgi:hypothetical protein